MGWMGTRSRQRVWFAIEAKSFELTMDGVGRRQKYVITERSRGGLNGYALEKKGCIHY